MVNYRRWLVKEEEGHPSSAVSNQSCWPQMITRGCAPFSPDIMNCHFHLSPDHNTEFCKRPKRWTAMGYVGRFRHPRFNESTPTSSGSERKRFLWSVGPEPLPDYSRYSTATLHGELFEKSLEQIIRAYIYQTRRKQPEKAREYSRLSSLFTAWVIPLAAREERRVYPQARH